MSEKILHHIQYAVGASIITIFCIILVRSLGITNLIHEKFFKEPETQITQEIKKTNPKIHTADNYEKALNKAKLLYEKGLNTLAIEEYSKASSFKPNKSEPYYLIALIHDQNSDIIKSEQYAKQAFDKENTNFKYINLYLKSLIKANHIDLAGDTISKIQSSDAGTLYYKGIVFAIQKKYDDSLNAFNSAKEQSSDESLSKKIQLFIDSYNEFNLTQSGQEIYRQALISKNLIKDEFYFPAIDILKVIIKEKYDYRDPWIMLGYSYLKLEQFKEAVEALQTALDIDPVKSETRYYLGLSYFGLTNYKDAISNIEIAIENGFEPKNEALQQLAEIAILNQEFEKSASSYEKILSTKKDDTEIYIRPIWLYIEKLNQPDKALTLANQAVKNNPENALAYSLLGWAQTAKGSYKEAYKSLEKSLELDPNLASTYLNLGWLYQKQEKFDEAKLSYKTSYDLDPYGPVGNLGAQRYNEMQIKN